MTTKDSPVAALRAQAVLIARSLKSASRGGPDIAPKLAASLAKGAVKFAVVMDDKLISISMPWDTVREASEASLVEYILAQMREEKPAA